MKIKSVLAALVGALALSGLSIGHARAVTAYSYTGPSFNSIKDEPVPAGSYDATMKITGFFSLASPLAAFEYLDGLSLLDWSFSDGRNTVSKANGLMNFFAIETNAGANVSYYSIHVSKGDLSLLNGPHASIKFEAFLFGIGIIVQCTVISEAGCTAAGVDEARYTRPQFGTWSVSETVVPLPAALPLFASILAGGGLIAWRRKRKAAKLATH